MKLEFENIIYTKVLNRIVCHQTYQASFTNPHWYIRWTKTGIVTLAQLINCTFYSELRTFLTHDAKLFLYFNFHKHLQLLLTFTWHFYSYSQSFGNLPLSWSYNIGLFCCHVQDSFWYLTQPTTCMMHQLLIKWGLEGQCCFSVMTGSSSASLDMVLSGVV